MSDQDPLLERLAALARLGADLGTTLRPDALDGLLTTITEVARRAFDAAACSIARLDEPADELVFVAASGAGADRIIGVRMSSGQGIAGWAVGSGQPIAIEEVGRDTRFQRDIASETGYIPTTILAMPLSGARGVIGVMEVLDPGPQSRAGVDAMDLLQLFGRQAAAALEVLDLFAGLGGALLATAAAGAPDADLEELLREAARDGGAGTAEVAELAALLHQLGAAGDDERRLAVRILEEVLRYARRRHRR